MSTLNTSDLRKANLPPYEQFKQQIREIADKIKETTKKVQDFIVNNKSLVFFALSVLFSYYMAPASAFAYLSSFESSILKEAIIEGVLFGTTILTLKNILGVKSFTNIQDDQINYLATISNIAQTYLCPTAGLTNAIKNVGFIGIKTAFHRIFASDEREVYFLMDNNQKAK